MHFTYSVFIVNAEVAKLLLEIWDESYTLILFQQ